MHEPYIDPRSFFDGATEPFPTEEVGKKEKEKNQEFRLAMSGYFRDLPSSLSLPGALELSKKSPAEIAAHEESYRHLYESFCALLYRHGNCVSLPSFDALLSRGITISPHKIESTVLERAIQHSLGEHLTHEVLSHFHLLSALIENLGTAMDYQKHRTEY